jgi:protocatechuate 3,4-dioxygenase beta subunit
MVTVTDANNCMAMAMISLTEPMALNLAATQVNVGCFGEANGSVDLTVAGGTMPYTYDWSNDGAETPDNDPQDLTSLTAGVYTVTVTDGNNCTATTSVTITQPAVLVSTVVSHVDVSCNGGNNGSVDLTVTGGTLPYTYDWSNDGAENPDDDIADVAGLAAGTYTVTVTDANLCTATTSITIVQPAAIALSISTANVLCFGDATGSIDLTANGGTAPLSYDWSNDGPETPDNDVQDLNGLTAGTYTVTVTDANGCSAVAQATLTQPVSAISLSVIAANVTCNGLNNGSINLSASGGTGVLTYDWSNDGPETPDNDTQDLSALAPGTYTVTVTDANNCSATISASITEPTVLSLSSTHVNASCNGGANGSIDLTATGGTQPYTYDWSNDGAETPDDDTADLTALTAGTYTVTVTDANGCSATTSVIITEPAAIVPTVTFTSATCGFANGSIDLSVTGGVMPYTYDWSNDGPENPDNDPQDLSGLLADTYTVTVTDANGCTATTVVMVNNINGPTLSSTQTNVTCFNGSNGTIDLTVTGGTGPFTYDWSNDGPETPDNDTQDLAGLTAGTYTVTVTDANGCMAMLMATLTQPTAILPELISVTNEGLCGDANGAINIIVSGGVGPYTYDWSNDGPETPDNDTEDLSGLSAGVYTVTITDAVGCPMTISATITCVQAAEIGNYTWIDANANGLQDGGESPLPNVAVILEGTDINGNLVNLTTATDGAGFYLFDHLWPGTYKLTFVTPTGGYVSTFANVNANGNDAADSDANPATGGMTVNEVLTPGESNLTYDAGYYIPASIGNYVWVDEDADGLQDTDEPGIVGVTVTLTGTDGLGNPVTLTTTTDANGYYNFINLVPGTYKLTFTTPAGGYISTPVDQGGNDASDSDANPAMGGMTVNEVLTSGENNPTYDAGYYIPASIGNYTWIDANANGIQDGGELPIGGVNVILTGTTGSGQAVNQAQVTGVNGLYLFSNLQPGTYKLTFGIPVGGYVPTTANDVDDPTDAADSDADPLIGGMTVNEVLVSGEQNLTYDAGYYIPASIGNFVWVDQDADGQQDPGEPGIGGATVTLTGTDGQGNPVTLTMTTAPDGSYSFTNLVPGTYKLTFTTPTGGYVSTDVNIGNDASDSDADPTMGGMTVNEVLTSGENNPTYDAGYYIPASIGNFTWIDANADGDQDLGEVPLPGVTVVLTGTTGTGESVNATQLTDANGLYLFTNLQPGTYKLTFETPIGGYVSTTPNDPQANDTNDSDADPAMGGMTINEVLVSGEQNLTYDAGYYLPASIGDFVWNDQDGDGVQDSGEPGIGGVTVTLTGTDGQGNPVTLTTTTNPDGSYNFPNLVPGTYKLTFTTPAGGYVSSDVNEGGNDATDSDADPLMGGMTANEVLTSGEHNPTYDAGYYIPAEIGNYTWIDANANGLQDMGELPISGVLVTLTGTSGAGDAVTLTATTDVNGLYLFTGLEPGTYKLTFTTPAGGYVPTMANDPDDATDALDSDADPLMGGMTLTEVLTSGESNLTYDAGYYIPASIGNFVWVDQDADGQQDPGEPGIGGTTVTLTGTDGQGNPVMLTTTTAPDGSYSFTNLVPGTYKLTFTTPAGGYVSTDVNIGNDASDSDADPTMGGMTVNEVLTSGENNPTYDAGYYIPASIGNFTWIDANADGDQDLGEVPLPGVTVVLTGTTGTGESVNATQLTDANGLYLFTNLQPGTYKLTFETPIGGYVSTTPNDPQANDTNDSDADPAMGGMTINEVLVSGEQNLTYDAGYYLPASIGNYVWNDLNANGIQENGESGIPNATVTLTGTDGQGNPVTLTTTTDGNGLYLFTNLVPGTYKLTFATPVGFLNSSPVDATGDALDSDANPAMGGMTVNEVLVSGEQNLTYDAGFYACPVITIAGLPVQPICPGEDVDAIFISTTPGAATISWSGGAAIGLLNGSAPGPNATIPAFIATAEGTVTVTVTAVLGNCTITQTFTLTVQDITPPVFDNCPTTMVMIGNDPDQCSGKLNWSIPTATDECATFVTVTQTGGPLSGTVIAITCPPTPQTITYTASDGNGNTATCTFQVMVIDTEKPEFDADVLMPGDVTVECDAVPTNCIPRIGGACTPLTLSDVNDNCAGPLTIMFTEESTQDPNVNNCGHYNYTITRTWKITDCADNALIAAGLPPTHALIHVQVITVRDTKPPTALCKNFTATLDKNGKVSILPADINNGSFDNCAPASALTYTVSGVDPLTCANIGANQVTLTVTDPCGNAATCQATVTLVEGIAPCTPQFNVVTTCQGNMGMGNATTLDNGQFLDIITIKSLAMQTWKVTVNSINNGKGLYSFTSAAPPAAPSLLPVGTLFTAGTADGIDNDGDGATDEADEMIWYTLKALHVDCQGYDITVSNDGGIGMGITATTTRIENKACYPTPYFTNLINDPFCLGTPPFTIEVGEYNNAAGSVVPGSIMVDGVVTNIFDADALGIGSHTVMATFDAGSATTNLVINGTQIGGTMAEAIADPGCKQKITQIVHIVETPSTLICNDLVTVSMDADCKVTLGVDDVLEGTYYCFDDYTVEVDKTLPMGNGPWVMAMFDASDIGKTFFYHVIHSTGGPNVCWGEIKIEDKLAPALDCPLDITIACSESTDVSHTGNVVVTDCSNYNKVIDDEYTDFGQCSSPRGQIVRTWIVTDAWGNQASCSQTITITPFDLGEVDFPEDVTVNCESAYLNPNATSPDVTGRPSINGFPIGTGGLCTASINYSDEIFDICPGSYEILRTWKVRNTCFAVSADNPIIDVQVITVTDLGGPAFDCPPAVTVSTDPLHCCCDGGAARYDCIGRLLDSN